MSQFRELFLDAARGAVYPFCMEYDSQVDALGLLCPLPVLRARKRLISLKKGQILLLLCDDPVAVVDVPHFCAEQGYELLGQSADGAEMRFFIRK